jgi:enoyl-CoA hydratase/carnithine racemase
VTGRIIEADEASSIRLVNRIVPPEELGAETDIWIERMIASSPMAIRRGKYAMRAMRDMSFEQMIAFAETMVGPMILTEDAREGMMAFAQKRSPNWPNA